MTDISFGGQTAIVTGGGRGIGRAYALELARRGASVVVNDVVAESADAVVSEIADAGGRAVASHHTVATPEGGRQIVDLALASFGSVHALINNAGILRNNLFEELTLDQIDEVVGVNLRGTFHVTQPAWRLMKANGYGRVVLTSSAAGLFSRPGSTNYSASKAAMYGICKALSFEGEPYGIKINTILPRAKTSITAGDPIPGWTPAANYDRTMLADLAPRQVPELNAPLAIYLASDACQVSGEAYSAVLGRYARVFVGLTPGWFGERAESITVEDVHDHLDEIRNQDGYTVPRGNHEEFETVLQTLGLLPSA